ncbi:hypothetical protein ACFQ5D_03640 [Paenibacillus farraposensis]|uniref:Uncharacterized protein n=1 Tax=Paenibacillus farraposensis TaxID=2807095 RepID=A0ABW4DC60_9BACL|nr:hypothetical protein [Paenibacillus farraposensis]MCC3382141.1 hypothetical protein [Paenibacillus farraposensis]
MASRDDHTTELHDHDFEASLQNAETNWENLIEEPDTLLENIPDADELTPDSPVDLSGPIEFLHGTDLLNGTDGDEDEELQKGVD